MESFAQSRRAFGELCSFFAYLCRSRGLRENSGHNAVYTFDCFSRSEGTRSISSSQECRFADGTPYVPRLGLPRQILREYVCADQKQTRRKNERNPPDGSNAQQQRRRQSEA